MPSMKRAHGWDQRDRFSRGAKRSEGSAQMSAMLESLHGLSSAVIDNLAASNEG